ncbi:MAG: GatB/YqeY domain-containing protein [Burkholderiaceae bacterium]
MSLKDTITANMKDAMRAKDAMRLGTIRMLLAAVKLKEIDERVEVDDTMAIAIVDKLIKQRKDSIEAYVKAERPELAAIEQAEIEVLKAYLPARMSAQEVTNAVQAIIAELGATGPGDMGKVMGAVKTQLAGKADMGQVSAAVKAGLQPSTRIESP